MRLIMLLLLLTTACSPQLSSGDEWRTAQVTYRDEVERVIRQFPGVINIESLEVMVEPHGAFATLEVAADIDPQQFGNDLTQKVRDVFAARHDEGTALLAVQWTLLYGDMVSRVGGSASLMRSGDITTGGFTLNIMTMTRAEATAFFSTPTGQ